MVGKNKYGYVLPGVYTKEIWERGGKVKEHKKYIGKYYTSWSSIESFNDEKGFNTGFKGSFEYILSKLFNVSFPDKGWALFGHQVEDYITLNKGREFFDESEIEVLDTIQPLGNYQREVCLYFKKLDVIVLGYIDDHSEPDEDGFIELVRDYKTKSESSKKELHKKLQLVLYVMYLMSIKLKVKKAEYVIIERLGGGECMKGGGRESLKVGKRVWYEEYTNLNKDTFAQAEKLVEDTVKKISSLFHTFLKFKHQTNE